VVEFYTVKRIDNSRLQRRRASGFLGSCGRQLAVAGVVVLVLLGYAWQRYECLDLSYRVQQLSQTHSRDLALNHELRVELATLRSPARIDLLARNQLGMTVPQPGQIIPSEALATGESADASAMVNPASFSNRVTH
jgi:cell division protein FtsL